MHSKIVHLKHKHLPAVIPYLDIGPQPFESSLFCIYIHNLRQYLNNPNKQGKQPCLHIHLCQFHTLYLAILLYSYISPYLDNTYLCLIYCMYNQTHSFCHSAILHILWIKQTSPGQFI